MPDNLPTETDPAVSVLDESNPYSLASKTTGRLHQAIASVPESYFTMQSEDLRDLVYTAEHFGSKRLANSILGIDEKVRHSFWKEYDQACRENRPVKPSHIYHGVVTEKCFFHSILTHPGRVAWIIQPSNDYDSTISSLLSNYLTRLKEISELPIYQQRCVRRARCEQLDACDCPKVPDAKVADVILRAYEKIELRAKGAVVQRVDERRIIAHMKSTGALLPTGELSKDAKQLTNHEIEQRLAQLESSTAKKPAEPEFPQDIIPEGELVDV